MHSMHVRPGQSLIVRADLRRQRQRWMATEPLLRCRSPHATSDDKPEQRRNQTTDIVTMQQEAMMRVVPTWEELDWTLLS